MLLAGKSCGSRWFEVRSGEIERGRCARLLEGSAATAAVRATRIAWDGVRMASVRAPHARYASETTGMKKRIKGKEKKPMRILAT